ncbi:MAG: hypothetical protein AB7N76_04260 [Planctomycetota bacterium]
MSFSFHITAYAPPSPSRLVEAVDDHGDLRVAEEVGDTWPAGFAYHLHREGRSTRGVELSWEPDQLQVRLLTLASPEDWELAFRVLEEAAGDATVAAENGVEVAPEALRETFGELCDLTNRGGAAFLQARIREDGASLTLPGPVRAFCIGPRLLAELGEGPSEELSDRILARIRQVQYTAEAEDYYCASVLQASTDEGRFTLAAFGPGVRYLMPEVQFVALVGEGDAELFLDYDAFLRLLGDWARYLDERQVFVEALSGPNWQAFLRAAGACTVEPLPYLAGVLDAEAHRARVDQAAAELARELRPLSPAAARQAEAQDADGAVRLLRSALTRRPDDAGVALDLAAALEQRAQARARRGELAGALADQDEALRLLAKAARRDRALRPDLALAWARRSDLSSASEAPRDALADLERAAAILEGCAGGEEPPSPRPGRGKASEAPQTPLEVALNLVATRCRQAEILTRLGEHERADEALDAAEERCARPEAWARLLRVRARLRRRRDPAASLADLRRAYELGAELARVEPEEVEGFVDVAEDLWEDRVRHLDVEGAAQACSGALSVLEGELSAGRARPAWIARVLGAHAAFLGARRRYREALDAARRALEQTRAVARPGDEPWVARACAALASALEDSGALTEAAEAYAQALAAYARSDGEHPGEVTRTRVLRASILSDAGNPAAAQAELERAGETLPPGEPEDDAARWLHAGVLHQRARAARLLGEVEQATSDVAAARALLVALEDDDPYCEGFLAVVRIEAAEVAAARGRDDEARAHALAGLEVLARHGAAGLHFGLQALIDGELLLAELDRRAGDPAGALTRAEALEARLDHEDPPLRRAQVLRARAAALADLGRPDDAAAALAETCRLLAQADHLPELLRALHDALLVSGDLPAEVSAVLDDLPARLPDAAPPALTEPLRALAEALVTARPPRPTLSETLARLLPTRA